MSTPNSPSSRLDLTPSGSSRWLKCKASPGFLQAHADEIPEEQVMPWTQAGTDAHNLASILLKGESSAGLEAIDLEMITNVQSYVKFVQEKMVPDSTLLVEQKVPLFYYPERNGYIDSAVIWPGNIYITDFKYGEGVSVEAKNNSQLAIYGLSFVRYLIDLGLYDSFPADTLVTLVIFQPRARDKRTVRLWALTLAELEEFCRVIDETAKSILADPLNQPFYASEDVCRFCPANGFCTERITLLLGEMPPEVKKPLEQVLAIPDVETLSPEVLGRVVNASGPIKKFFEKARARAFKMATDGLAVPGCKLVQGRNSRSWRSETDAEKLLRGKFPVDEIAPRTLVSPAQAEKLLKGQETSTRFNNLFNSLIVSTPGEPTLVSDDDPRPALDTKAEQEFSDLDADAAKSNSTLLD